MAPKRAAKGSARPPPPPPPPAASSSEETDSRSQSEESEDEAVSPTPAPKKLPAPQQNGGESESSDEEEDGDEEEPNQAAPPSAQKNQPPPPQQSKEPDASDEEGDEGESSESDEEAPTLQPAPKQEAEDIKPPSAKKARLAFHRVWSTEDEVRILEALAAHQKQNGALPQPDALISALAGKLDNPAYGSKELQSKLQALKRRHVILTKKGGLPSKEHDRRLLDLSTIVWGGGKTTAAAAAKAASGHEPKGFEEMCELYPYLAEEVKKLEGAHGGMVKRVFGKMDDGKARLMDEKIKKQRIVQMKVELGCTELSAKVAKAIMELID